MKIINKAIEYAKKKITKKFLKYLGVSIFVTVIGFIARYVAYDLFRITVIFIEPIIVFLIWVIRYVLQLKYKIIEKG